VVLSQLFKNGNFTDTVHRVWNTTLSMHRLKSVLVAGNEDDEEEKLRIKWSGQVKHNDHRELRCLTLEGLLEEIALLVDLCNSSSNIDAVTLTETIEQSIRLTEICMIIAACSEILQGKSLNAAVSDGRLNTLPRRRLVASSLFVATLILAIIRSFLLQTITVARARLVTTWASRKSDGIHARLGSFNDAVCHSINSFADRKLILKFLPVLFCREFLVSVLSKSERNINLGNATLRSTRDFSFSTRNGLLCIRSNNVIDGHGADGVNSTVATGLAVVTLTLDVVEVIVPSITRMVVPFQVGQKVVRELITGEIAQIGIVVARIGILTNRSGSCNVRVGRKLILVEHRTRIASISVKDEVLEHVLCAHGVKSLLQFYLTQGTIRESERVHTTMITIVDDDIVVSSRPQRLAATRNTLASHQKNEVFGSHKLAGVIMGNASIDILTTNIIDDLARVRILGIIRDIVIHHNDDPLLRNTHVPENMERMANVCLHAIVLPPICTGSK